MPTVRRHAVPPEIKRTLAQAAIGLHPVSFSLRRRLKLRAAILIVADFFADLCL